MVLKKSNGARRRAQAAGQSQEQQQPQHQPQPPQQQQQQQAEWNDVQYPDPVPVPHSQSQSPYYGSYPIYHPSSPQAQSAAFRPTGVDYGPGYGALEMTTQQPPLLRINQPPRGNNLFAGGAPRPQIPDVRPNQDHFIHHEPDVSTESFGASRPMPMPEHVMPVPPPPMTPNARFDPHRVPDGDGDMHISHEAYHHSEVETVPKNEVFVGGESNGGDIEKSPKQSKWKMLNHVGSNVIEEATQAGFLNQPEAGFRPYEMLPEEVKEAADSDGSGVLAKDYIIVSQHHDPFAGKWYPLKVMYTHRGNNSSRQIASWDRCRMKNEGPWWVRLVDYPWKPRLDEERDEDSDVIPEKRTKWEVTYRALGAWSLLMLVSFLPASSRPIKMPYRFAPLLYSYDGYAKSPRNPHEKEGWDFMDDDEKAAKERELPDIEDHLRCTWPEKLARLINPKSKQLEGYKLCEYIKQTGNPSPLPPALSGMHVSSCHAEKMFPSYVFISYTGEHFKGHDPAADLAARKNLVKYGEWIARQRGLEAFWLSSIHIAADDERVSNVSSEVYRMSDIVRSAAEVVIVLPPGRLDQVDLGLNEWGSRLWTFPEVLLSKNSDVPVYVAPPPQNGPGWAVVPREPLVMNKYVLAEKAWRGDLGSSRQLIDHFLGTIHLSRLELSLVALRCMRAREFGRAFDGDVSYVLMGLLRNRPEVVNDDTEFQAFARLSLANDSDHLLERAISLQPPKIEMDSWLCLKDEFGCNLWDIEPECQVAAVCDDDTVILDGAYGAAIRWNSFPRELSVGTGKGLLKQLLKTAIIFFGAAIGFLASAKRTTVGVSGSSSSTDGGLVAGGVIFLLLAIFFAWCSPYYLRRCRDKYFTQPEPWLIGFEGHLPIRVMETVAFGRSYGVLQWSPHGSSMSLHTRCDHMSPSKRGKSYKLSEGFSKCVGVDPASSPKVRRIIDECDRSNHGEEKVFTIIDTVSMTATLITARKPPVAAIVCGREGGMKRAVLCSYDCSTNTLNRQTVMRLATPTVDKMFRVNRFKFGYGFKRYRHPLGRAPGSRV